MTLEHLDTTIAFAVVMLLLSLLITSFVQVMIAVTRLRGSNLLWGVERLIGQLDPKLRDEATTLAKKVLLHPALTHIPDRLATAIRPSELVIVLKDLADGDPDLKPETKTALKTMFERTAGEGSDEMIAKAEELIGKLDKAFPQQTALLRETVERTLGATQQIVVKVDAWFDTVMDRTSERFKMRSRLFTVVFAFIFGFLLQIDSLAIIQQLSNDPVLKERVVQAAVPALQTAEKLQNEAKKQTASEAIEAVARQLQLTLPKIPEDIDDEAKGDKWLADNTDEEVRKKALALYHDQYQEIAKNRLAVLPPIISDLQDQLAQTSLTLIPDGFWMFPNYWDGRHLAGMFMTGVLLSLGAPFWYNALRRLSDLRPIVARKVEGEAPKAKQ
ncbi:MAG TPA: hypothetical protein VGG03_24255 [Thermoanaerobaculia bacterium]|jgi:hypothetical protein